uniref:F-box domain-containing protein n=1 Tax=Solanum lycopersicum TaxID=4081 RepID=A0A3Q7H9X5_SOLLC
MMVLIFSKFQLKSLLQLRCLSKSLNELISSPNFIWLHTKQFVLLKTPTHLFKRYFSKGLQKEKIQLIDVSNFDNPVMRLRSPFSVDLSYYFYCRIIGICNTVLFMLDALLDHSSPEGTLES